MARQIKHPSNRLYNNECDGFVEAMGSVIAQCDYEMGVSDDDPKLKSILQEMKEKAVEARTEYVQRLNKLNSEFAVWLRSFGKENDYSNFAEAIESGDYSGLAI